LSRPDKRLAPAVKTAGRRRPYRGVMKKRLGLGVLTFLALGVGVVTPMLWLLGVFAELPEKPPLVAHLLEAFTTDRAVFLVHIVAGGVALVLGPWQLMPRLRAWSPRLHRGTGMIYVAAVVAAGAAGLVMGPRAWGGPVAQVGFTSLAVAWLVTTLTGMQRILAGDRAGHRVWMTRSLAVTFAAVSLRLQTPLLAALGVPDAIAYPLVAWSSWVPTLVVLEWRRALRHPAHPTRRPEAC
jgi:uncharacterized membrane protein